ncbi:deoxyribose-phosphate aldolase-like isoform X2 [Sinocyclocheilus grahami]|uniref:deoxyribose-phosphate aldolase-like isoform X2 n=1 Tax=Sinocyclocheilus grahami TaxID=75366 RepID=UPI0007AC5A34|nr:PREDICTED: deoxyribose-phosphate aldolase-like isoform X2 [Sinocyclocheilus grahami]
MSARNPGMHLDLEWVSKVRVNTQAVLKRAQQIQGHKVAKKQWQAAWMLKAVTCIDLTTLAGDDTPSNVHRLCMKATQPIRHDLLKSMDMHDKGITTAAVCVYPSRVADAVKSLKAANSSLPVASVATGFPAGQTPLKTRLAEVQMAVEDGATEIDIVINRTLALTGQWAALYDEIRQFREACADAHMKTILAVGELGTFTNVYKASLVSMMAAWRHCSSILLSASRCPNTHTHTHTHTQSRPVTVCLNSHCTLSRLLYPIVSGSDRDRY